MLGLGIGSLIGDVLSKRKHLIHYFSLFELSVGIFGIFSTYLFEFTSKITLGDSTFYLFLISFILLIFPTSAMGATLPILTKFLVQKFNNIGSSLGMLYFVNTLGAAFASIITAFYLMELLGLQGTIYLAATMNIVVALLGIVIAKSGN